jgi:hypothetical protein
MTSKRILLIALAEIVALTRDPLMKEAARNEAIREAAQRAIERLNACPDCKGEAP